MLVPKIFPVTCHTDHVGHGSTFVAIKGFKTDGEIFIQKAKELGANKIITEKDVKNTREALAKLSSEALDLPALRLNIIGITGTSGKTTTTYLIDHILNYAGYKTALMGTIKNKIIDQEEEGDRTTPESDYIQMFLAQCVKNKVDYVTMEVSSHAIDLFRVHTIPFSIVGFTNLSQDHLDYHKTMEEYFSVKLRLFKSLKENGLAVINNDNFWGHKSINFLKEEAFDKNHELITFGTLKTEDNKNPFVIAQNSKNGIKVKFNDHELYCSKLLAEFNCYNILMATLICKKIGVSINIIQEAIKDFNGVPGRLQMHTLKNGAKAFVDYSHKPDPFEQVLKTLKNYTDNLIVVFGCGGERDTTKRPIMGKFAALYCDNIIITDDNPRCEPREKISQEIISGIPKASINKVKVILDRKNAIEEAVKLTDKNSIIALLGKGHETHYLINNRSFYFSDFEEVSKF
jgi:UDP-N-acetylmuramoyl-L-alanyl-D-glutamate--2,6-diaminopimelate ligase